MRLTAAFLLGAAIFLGAASVAQAAGKERNGGRSVGRAEGHSLTRAKSHPVGRAKGGTASNHNDTVPGLEHGAQNKAVGGPVDAVACKAATPVDIVSGKQEAEQKNQAIDDNHKQAGEASYTRPPAQVIISYRWDADVTSAFLWD